ncbi:MAG TPA: hypothetical protein VFX50_12325, partial [Gemmatimonadales bacterium]|nr:hypothetical protein [Gemmatimonadales bacterium]
MIRRVVATAVLLTWAGSMVWLAKRTANAPAAAVAREEALPIAPASAYYSLRLDTTLVGFASITLDTSVTAVTIQEVIDLRLPDGDSLLRVMLRGETSLSRGLKLRSFAYMRTVNGRRTAVRGAAVGDSLLEWQVGQERSASAPDTVALPGTRVHTPTTLPLALVFGGLLRPGSVRNLPVADPLTRQVRMGAMRILGDSTFVVPDSSARDTVAQRFVPARWDTLHAWRIERRGLGAPSEFWVDDDGLPVAGEWVPGLTLERRPFEIASQAYREAIAARFPAMPRAAGHTSLRRPVRAVPRLAVHLAGLRGDSAGWVRSGLAGGPQRLSHDTLVTGVADSAPAAGTAAARDGLVPALDPAVIAEARAIAGDEDDALRLVRRLAAWTAGEVGP